MTTVLRRILVPAFITVLAALGVVTALLGRRPRGRIRGRAEVLAPLPSSRPVSRRAGDGRGRGVGFIGLLLLMGSAGVVYESRDVLFGVGLRAPEGAVKPPAVLAPPDGGSVQTSRIGEPVTLQPPRPPASAAPDLDAVRSEPNGDAVIAGPTAPNAVVALLLDGKPMGSARADADGRFTFMPPRLPIGRRDVGLRATGDAQNARATAGSDGTVTFAIGHGVGPGDDTVRLDRVDAATGKVRDRVEVPFPAPAAGHDAGVEYAAGPDASGASVPESDVARRAPPVASANPPQPSSTGSLAANVSAGSATGLSEVSVSGLETARIERGDGLWRISRRRYGAGERFTLIYDANRAQIRDPDLIYPGQVFVLPREHAGEAIGDGRPR